MKYLIILICFGYSLNGVAQDTTKTKKKSEVISNKKVKGVKKLPQIIARKPLVDENTSPSIFSAYLIEKYTVMVRTSESKLLAKTPGSLLTIEEEQITGDQIDPIALKFSDTEVMETADYLYRVLGIVPDEIPADLPASLKVHRTNNLDCYGIAEVSDQLVIMPYKGALLYLKRK